MLIATDRHIRPFPLGESGKKREEVSELRKFLALLLSLFAIASLATVSANPNVTRDTDSTPGASVPTTGVKLSMYRGIPLGSCSLTDPNVAPADTSFPANTAFFLRHGFVASLSGLSGKDQGAFLGSHTRFELYIDGNEQQRLPDFSNSQGVFLKLFVFNNANGMTGTHVFRGWWIFDAGLDGGTYGQENIDFACALNVHFV